jgi:hypothetical protein
LQGAGCRVQGAGLQGAGLQVERCRLHCKTFFLILHYHCLIRAIS